MKKIIFLIIMILASFITVLATDCKDMDVACATCFYETNTFLLKYTVESNGSTGATIKHEVIHLDKDGEIIPSNKLDATILPVNIKSSLVGTNFIDTDANKILCLSKVYYTATGGRQGSTYNIFSKPKDGSKASMSLDTTRSKNNNKFLNGKEEKDDETITCSYTSQHLVGQSYQDGGPRVTATSNGKDFVNYEFEEGYILNKNQGNDVKPEDFMVNGKLKCPNLSTVCGGDGTNKFCSVSKEDLTIGPGGDPTDGDEEDDANEINKENGNGIVTLEPNIDVNLNFGNGKCGLISTELQEFLQWILDLIRISGLVLTVAMGVLDYAKATFSSNDDTMKQANKNFSTRLLCLAILLLVPTLVSLTLAIFDIGITADDPTCGIY